MRLIRSKGVGVYFVTQNPLDVPDKVLAQLGNRVQHALRAFTPRDQKAVRAAAETFRANPKLDTAKVIMELGKGEALVSFLEGNGTPSMVERCMVRPPSARVGPITPEERKALMAQEPGEGQIRPGGRSGIRLRGAAEAPARDRLDRAAAGGHRRRAGRHGGGFVHRGALARFHGRSRRHPRRDLRHQPTARHSDCRPAKRSRARSRARSPIGSPARSPPISASRSAARWEARSAARSCAEPWAEFCADSSRS